MIEAFAKVSRAKGSDGLGERWGGCEVCPTLNIFDNMSEVRAVVLANERGIAHDRRTVFALDGDKFKNRDPAREERVGGSGLGVNGGGAMYTVNTAVRHIVAIVKERNEANAK